MVELDVEHILILVIVAFMLYHLSSCRCFNNGFRVGGASDNTCDILVKGCKGGKCVGKNLSYCDAVGVDFSLNNGADLTGADLTGAGLPDTNFTNATLINADLENADLKGAKFINANLKGAYLMGADVYQANFKGANLSGADLWEIINPLDAKCTTKYEKYPTIFPENNVLYYCSQEGKWKYINCSDALQGICPSTFGGTISTCLNCAAKNQLQLHDARCGNNDIHKYCYT